MTRMTSLWVLLVLVCPSSTLGQKKAAKNQPTEGTAQEYAQLAQLREVTGKLAKVDSSTKMLALDIDYQNAYPAKTKKRAVAQRTRHGGVGNVRPTFSLAQFNHRWENILRLQQQLMTISNPMQRMQKLQQLELQIERLQMQILMSEARALAACERQQLQVMMSQLRNLAAASHQGNVGTPANTKLTKGTKEFRLEAQNDVIVRRWAPPLAYDDKGNVKPHTKEELKVLRGKNPSLPGYTASYEDLQAGQMVKMYLPAPKVKNDKQIAKDDADRAKAKLPQVRMILILADAVGRDPQLAHIKKKGN